MPRRAAVSPEPPAAEAAASAHDRVLDAALQLFAQRGIAGATTREIAQLAGVNEVTLFRHFGSKEGVVHAVVERFVPQVALPRLDRVPCTGDLEADLYALAMTLFEFHAEREDFFRFAFANLVQEGGQVTIVHSVHQQMLQWWSRYFRRHTRQGWDADSLAFAFVAPLVMRTIRRVFLSEDEPDAATFARTQARVFARALAGEGRAP